MNKEALSNLKRSYVNNDGSSVFIVNMHELRLSKLDDDTKHRVALKAVHDAASQLGLKIRPRININFPYVEAQVDFD